MRVRVGGCVDMGNHFASVLITCGCDERDMVVCVDGYDGRKVDVMVGGYCTNGGVMDGSGCVVVWVIDDDDVSR